MGLQLLQVSFLVISRSSWWIGSLLIFINGKWDLMLSGTYVYKIIWKWRTFAGNYYHCSVYTDLTLALWHVRRMPRTRKYIWIVGYSAHFRQPSIPFFNALANPCTSICCHERSIIPVRNLEGGWSRRGGGRRGGGRLHLMSEISMNPEFPASFTSYDHGFRGIGPTRTPIFEWINHRENGSNSDSNTSQRRWNRDSGS